MASPPSQLRSALSDEQLLERYRLGDRASFEQLIERYRLELFHFLARFIGERTGAEDIFQETFLQVHLSAGSFDAERRFKPWLFTIAANKARDFMRRRARRPAAPIDAPIAGGAAGEGQTFVDLMQADLPAPDEKMERAELQSLVQRTIGQMPEHLREILLLAYFQRFSYNEIADVLKIPLGTVKSRLHTAVAMFARLWQQQNSEARSS